MRDLLKRRPAESMTGAGAVAFLIARALGVEDAATITAMTVALGLVPSIVTFGVEQYRKARSKSVTVSIEDDE